MWKSPKSTERFFHLPFLTNKIYKLKLKFRLLKWEGSKIDGEMFSLAIFNK